MNDGDDELLYGTRVSFVSLFLIFNDFGVHRFCNLPNDAEQVNGQFILEIKKRWPCASHQGEHGEPGHCFITVSGGHL